MNHFTSIYNIQYWNFLEARKTGDARYILELPSYLDINNKKVTKEVVSAWENILNEYNDIVLKRNEARGLFEIKKQIAELTTEKMICDICVNQIKLLENNAEFAEYVNAYISELEALGYEYSGNIDALSGRVDAILNELDDLAEQEKLYLGSGDSISIERHINNIEKHRGVPIDIKKTSAAQFLAYEDDYIEHINRINKNKRNATD